MQGGRPLGNNRAQKNALGGRVFALYLDRANGKDDAPKRAVTPLGRDSLRGYR